MTTAAKIHTKCSYCGTVLFLRTFTCSHCGEYKNLMHYKVEYIDYYTGSPEFIKKEDQSEQKKETEKDESVDLSRFFSDYHDYGDGF